MRVATCDSEQLMALDY